MNTTGCRELKLMMKNRSRSSKASRSEALLQCKLGKNYIVSPEVTEILSRVSSGAWALGMPGRTTISTPIGVESRSQLSRGKAVASEGLSL